jgi:DNA polymerase III subunit gamma/tau
MTDVPFVSLYRRFRPGRFDELRGQDHVVRALQSAVRDDRVSHAYLFSGPRGTGKTSSARILAKALNCAAPVDGEPCGVCSSCTEITQGTSLDVHELDAASNNGVEAMRDLVAHAGLGTPGRWKVYIVDEVHMLSNAAANALLKTLEEPPGHVVFVLATTDPQKVPDTIKSRTQHLEFRLLGADTLHDLLESVRTQAGLDVDEESVEAAVRRARGSARDALSALDQVAASGSSDSGRPELTAVLAAYAEGDVRQSLISLSALLAGGWGPQQLATELIDDLRQVFLAALAPELCTVSGQTQAQFNAWAESIGLARVVRGMEILGRALVDMRDAPDAQVVLEIAMVRATRPDLDAGVEALAERVGALERGLAAGGGGAGGGGTGAVAPRAIPRAEAAPVVPEPAAPVADVGRRPSVGAVRRRQVASAATGAAAGEEVDEETSAVLPDVDVPAPAPAAAVAPTPTVPIDRDSLTQAWGDGILRNLPARAKALFSAGRFVSFADGTARFALPNAAHRDRCLDMARDVEGALSNQFGTPVALELVVDDGAGSGAGSGGGPSPAPSTGTRAVRSAGPDERDDHDEVDPDDLRAATSSGADQASDAEARLLEAFPGASEVSP